MGERRAVPGERLEVLEGLRGYLAIYIVSDHCLESSGYVGALPEPLLLLRGGGYAVDLFVIISGFVIFFLLDKQAEGYRAFVVRRFFRLYPLAIAMFALAIPISKLRLWNTTHADAYLAPDQIAYVTNSIHEWWDNLSWNVFFHGTMLHGIVPESVIPRASEAFLDPAWSISLEWQFYLVAPLLYALATRNVRTRITLCAACAALVLVRRLLPSVGYGAALPFHAEFFFVGGASFFVYRSVAQRTPLGTPVIAACAAFFLFVVAGRPHSILPLCAWVIVLGVLCAAPADPSRRWFALPFTNRLAELAGRLSYAVYLSHILLLAIVQFALLRFAPGLDRPLHFAALFAGTLVLTLPFAAFVHAVVELPFMRLGRTLATVWGTAPSKRATVVRV